MPQKILICGFMHCGTSILKSVIGHIDCVEEIHGENVISHVKTDKKFILTKWPWIYDSFFKKDSIFKDVIKIFIVRNPVYVFSSMNKRFNYNYKFTPISIKTYSNIVKKFSELMDKKEDKIYTIRYEDLFKNNYESLKKILNDIGFEYDDSIFDNSKYKNYLFKGLESKEEPNHYYNTPKLRAWQINQPFKSNNHISKINLKQYQKDAIKKDPYFLKVFPEIKSMI